MRLIRLVLVCGMMMCCGGAWLGAQPERLLYFPDTGRQLAVLDPGDELLQRNVLITNRESAYNVSFSLSFDQQKWSGFALNPRYSSIFSLMGLQGCYIRVRTQRGEGDVSEVVYYLLRGRCYSVYWNREQRRWDILENRCR